MSPAATSRHPPRGPTGIVGPLAALIAGPAAWAAQLIIGYGSSSLACYPHDAPAAQAPGAGEHVFLIALNLACLAIALIGLGAAILHWRQTRPAESGESSDAMPAGGGRARFLAACGVLSGLGFAIAILFDTAPILSVPACWSLFR